MANWQQNDFRQGTARMNERKSERACHSKRFMMMMRRLDIFRSVFTIPQIDFFFLSLVSPFNSKMNEILSGLLKWNSLESLLFWKKYLHVKQSTIIYVSSVNRRTGRDSYRCAPSHLNCFSLFIFFCFYFVLNSKPREKNNHSKMWKPYEGHLQSISVV